MNYLGHFSLSHEEFFIQLGNLSGDLLKGRPWLEANDQVRLGFKIHQEIDQYTDSHPAFSRLSRLLFGNYRHYGRVVADLLIDYYLVKHWHQFHKEELGLMVERFFECYHRSAEELPEEVNLFLKHLREKSLLTSYGTDKGLEKAVVRIKKRGKRMSSNRPLLAVIAPFAAETEELCCRLYSDVRESIMSSYFH